MDTFNEISFHERQYSLRIENTIDTIGNLDMKNDLWLNIDANPNL